MRIFKIIFGFIIVVSVVLISVFRKDLDASHACANFENFKQAKYNGTVIRKYIDQKNHRAPTVQIKQGQDFVFYVLPRDVNDFYNFIEPGDDVIKKRGDSFFSVHRESVTRQFKIAYGCDQHL